MSPWFLALSVVTLATSAAPAATPRPLRCELLMNGEAFAINQHVVPLHRLERMPSDELRAMIETDRTVRAFLKTQYGQGPTRRGVHPYAHGAIRGKMTIAEGIEPSDQVGIFKPGHVYEVVARFSNGNPRGDARDDAPDSRGFGLKVLGVEGSPLLKIPGGQRGVQDFTLNSSDAFFADRARTYARFMQIGLLETNDFSEAAKQHVIQLIKRLQWPLAWRVFRAFKKIQNVHATNPLGIEYFSIAAFQHGEGIGAPIVKYKVEPCDGVWEEYVDVDDPHYLKFNLVRHITRKPACFRFMIQDFAFDLDIEDLTRPWDEKRSPFRELARIEFPTQQPLTDAEAENLVINPWNTLAAHKPVGGINRFRLAAYLLSIEARKARRAR